MEQETATPAGAYPAGSSRSVVLHHQERIPADRGDMALFVPEGRFESFLLPYPAENWRRILPVGEDRMERMAIDEEVYQRIESGLNGMRHTNQKLIRHGTEKNRDLIAAEFEKDIRGISDALREIEVSGSVGGHRG